MQNPLIFQKRIVLLTDCLADLAGGAEKQIYELARGLDKNSYEVHVVSLDCWGKAPKEVIEATGSQLHIFRVVRIYGLSGLIQGLRFYHFLKNNRIDILLTYHFSSDIWGTFWGHWAGVKTIISNRRDMGFWRNHLHVLAYKLINPWVNKMVVVSQSIKEMIIKEEGVDASRIEVVYNGVELPEKQLGVKNKDIVIMHVANLKPIKGHQYLIEAFAEISRQNQNVKLVLIGRDELNGQLQKMVQDLNIASQVEFLGKRDDVQGLLAGADICVLPSLSEGMSNSILEYMAAGKPVIATSVGGNPELVKDGINGLLVDKENVEQLKVAMLKLIKDKELRLKMGQSGYLRVKEEFSMGAMIGHYEILFKEIAASPSATRNDGGIRILHLISSGGLFGAERVVLNLASKSGDLTMFVGAINNLHNPHLEMIEEAKRSGLNTLVVDSQGRFDLGTIKAVKKFIKQNKIDIVHTHNYKSDMIGFGATRFTKVKWVATNHLWHSTDRKLKFYENIDAFILKFAQKVIAVSSDIKNDLLQNNLKEERLEIIDNGISIEKFNRSNQRETIRQSLGIKPEDCAMVIVGRLAIEKGHEVFLKAAVEVIKKIQDVKFIIVGDGPLKEELIKQTHDLNLQDYFIFTGIRKDMPAIYAAGDILINASFAEGLPMTILEAMASHLPVIATDVGAVGEVIQDQENGILLKAGDYSQLALSMIELINDKDKRHRLADKAYRVVSERYSDVRMVEKYREVYNKII